MFGEYYKKPSNKYDFKKKIMAAMKRRHDKVSAPGAHSSSSNPEDYETPSAVDKLAEKLYKEYKEITDKKEALRRDTEALKQNIQAASDTLAPPPPPLPPCPRNELKQPSLAARNPLSAIDNNVPLLLDEDYDTKEKKRQRLTSKDASGDIKNFMESGGGMKELFSEYMESKKKTEAQRNLMELYKMKARGEISQEEFDLLKNT
jgi:hypothetical protein